MLASTIHCFFRGWRRRTPGGRATDDAIAGVDFDLADRRNFNAPRRKHDNEEEAVMLQIKVGLVDTTGAIDSRTMAAAAAAINTQVTRDLPQYWNINASVAYLTDPHRIPQGFWPVQLVKSLPPPEGGFHLTHHNQPYAKVIATPGSDDWIIDASHETLEMLVDPAGNRLQASTEITLAGNRIEDGDGTFEYLVEVCDPCEGNEFGYQINGLTVSDFLTPHFYDLNATSDARFSFTGALKAPREILPGGYISWANPQTSEMQQLLFLGPTPEIKNLGPAQGASLRAFVDAKTRHHVHESRKVPGAKIVEQRKAHKKALDECSVVRAKHYT
jgi:hypothetical protein